MSIHCRDLQGHKRYSLADLDSIWYKTLKLNFWKNLCTGGWLGVTDVISIQWQPIWHLLLVSTVIRVLQQIRPVHLCLIFSFSNVHPFVWHVSNLLYPTKSISSAFFSYNFMVTTFTGSPNSFHPLAIFFCYLWICLPRYCHLSVTSHKVWIDNWIYWTSITHHYK
jgi:hypothetical protein